jgi:hypothetical protein
MVKFSLRFPRHDVPFWAKQYVENARKENWKRESRVLNEVAQRIHALGYLTKSDFLDICLWKSPRPMKYYKDNSKAFIEHVSRIAFSTTNDRLRMEILTLLHGIGWPVASAILHVGHRDPYPILDRRALWSLGVGVPAKYDFRFWQSYTEYCRQLAKQCGTRMRDLDRALWQYSKENQRG